MSEYVQSGAVGALLAQFAGIKATDATGAGPDARAETSDGAPQLFGELFADAAGAGREVPKKVIEAGVFTVHQRSPGNAELVTPGPDSPSSVLASDFSTPSYDTLLFGSRGDAGQNIRFRNFSEFIVVRANDGDSAKTFSEINTQFNKPFLQSGAAVNDGAIVAQRFGDIALSTVKLGASQGANAQDSLTAIKLSPQQVATPEAPLKTVKVKRPTGEALGFDIRNIRPDGNGGFRIASAPLTDAVTGLRQASAERGIEFEPRLEASVPRGDVATTKLFPSPTQTAAAHIAFLGAYNPFSGPVGAHVEFVTAFDADIAGGPGFSTGSAATTNTAPATGFALTTAPTQAALSGVLPQIQAAVFARNGRDVVEVRLDPPDLGRVRINFSVEGAETIKAVLGAERAETLDYLKRNIVDLEAQLRQAGFASISFEFSGSERAFGNDSHDTRAPEPAFADAADEAVRTNLIYLSPREDARLDLLL